MRAGSGGRYENIIISIGDLVLYLILMMKSSFRVRRRMSAWGQTRKSMTATRMSAVGGKADEIKEKADI